MYLAIKFVKGLKSKRLRFLKEKALLPDFNIEMLPELQLSDSSSQVNPQLCL